MPRPKRDAKKTAAPTNKARKGKKKSVTKDVPQYVDEDAVYGNVDGPDPESREYIYDDIDEFHASREKVLLDGGYQPEQGMEDTDEEEVLALDSEDSDDEEIRELKAQLRRVKQYQRKDALGSDLEDQPEDDEEADLPDNKAWGSRRSKYYGDDDIDLNRMASDDEDAEALLEEKEAIRLQKQMAEELDDQDFGLDMFQPSEKVTKKEEKGEKIVKDLSTLSEKEKLKLIKKKSPELLTLIDEFKEKMAEFQKLNYLKDWIEKEKRTGSAVDYVYTKMRLNLNYCTNIVFYLMLKSKQLVVENHPVIKRLLQYKKISKQLEVADDQLRQEIDDIVGKLKNGETVVMENTIEQPRTFTRIQKTSSTKESARKKKLSDLAAGSDDEYEEYAPKTKIMKPDSRFETKDEQEALEYYESMKAGRPEEGDSESDMEEPAGEEEDLPEPGDMEEDGKRAISYQIEKNKGLTAHKKKELRNPRVKHRMKFKKAKIRRKGQYREPRTEMQKYGGEISGIRAGVKRGVKLK